MRKPQFKTEIIVSVYFTKILRKGDFGDIHNLMSYLVGDKAVINTNLVQVSAECSQWLEQEVPWLKKIKLPASELEYGKLLAEIVTQHGPWVALSPISNPIHKPGSYLYQVAKNGLLSKVFLGRVKILIRRLTNFLNL